MTAAQTHCRHCEEMFQPTPGQKLMLCKPCRNVVARAARVRRREQGNPIPSYVEPRERKRERNAEYMSRPTVRQRQREREAQRRADPQEQLRKIARNATTTAVRYGKLIRQPCRDCGAGKVQAHHTDYSKPLEVVWLCAVCHRAEHDALAKLGVAL